ncbi:MAG: hypothetical protein QGH60_09240 [Phycisphaerae bacterium]|jgi:hypothetical protein|nr:hypothetical protein [Phycisphaerae bacterium]
MRIRKIAIPCILVTSVCLCAALAQDAAKDPVAVRAHNIVVPPDTGPVSGLTVMNLLDAPYTGKVTVTLPNGWKADKTRFDVSLKPHETKHIAFAIEKATANKSHVYPYRITAVGGGKTVTVDQQVICATTPVVKPKIDGDITEWLNDAVPVTFVCKDKKTVVRTYWNKRNFCLAVEVQEDKFDKSADAIQFALAYGKASTGKSPDDKTARYEFVIVGGKCYQVAKPGRSLGDTQKSTALPKEPVPKSVVAVKREKDITTYEISVPIRPMRKVLKPTTGREYRFGVLVHDPDGTGLRQMAAVASPLPGARSKYAWTKWIGAKFPDKPLLDSKLEWGFCTSIH